MATIANTFTRFDSIGEREALSDAIYDISPMDTPVVSMAAKGGTDQVLFEWQTDELQAATDDNAHPEGDDIDAFPATPPTTRVGNYVQISRKLLLLSGTVEVTNKAGRNSELAFNTAKRSRELKRDMEAIVTANQGGDGGSFGNARRTATLGAWLKTNTVFNAGGGAPAGSDPTYTSGVPGDPRGDATDTRPFTETLLKEAIQSLYTAGGEPHTLVVGPVNKQVVSGFSGVVTRNFDISNADPRPTAVIAAIDVYVSDFGTIRVVPNRFSRERDAWLLDPEHLAIKHLRPFKVEKLAKTGDNHKRMLLVEWGLQVKQEAGLAAVYDLDTSL